MIDRTLGYVDITCSEHNLLRPWKKAQFFKNIDAVLDGRRRLAAGERGWITARLKTLITNAGFCPTPCGLLADLDLRAKFNVLNVGSYDWMRNSFQDGFMTNAMWLAVRALAKLKRRNDDCTDVIAHLETIQFPLARRDTL